MSGGAEEIKQRIEGAEEVHETLAETVARLAALAPAEYDLQRRKEATRLGIRTVTLDAEVQKLRNANRSPAEGDTQGQALELPTPKPWPETVDGAVLLSDLSAIFKRYLVAPPGAHDAMSIWTVHTYAHEAAEHSPRIGFESPAPRCGKTTALDLIGCTAARPLSASNISSAAVFRTIEAASPTLLIDEADTFLKDNDELRGVLNSGHSRSLAFVVRTVGEEHEPRRFSTWAPLAVAMIGKLPATIRDRSVVIPLKRKKRTERLERLRRTARGGLAELARKCARWAQDTFDALKEADPAIPEALDDRAADSWRPLLAIADLAGSEWPERARKAALALSAPRGGEDESIGQVTLAAIRRILQGRERISSEDLCKALCEFEHGPWSEYRDGKPISKPQLARLLRPFGVAPHTVRLSSGETAKGYDAKDFADAFERYLPQPESSSSAQDGDQAEIDRLAAKGPETPPSSDLLRENPLRDDRPPFQTVTTSQLNGEKGCKTFSDRNSEDNVTVRKVHSGNGANGCDDVTVSKGGMGDPKEKVNPAGMETAGDPDGGSASEEAEIDRLAAQDANQAEDDDQDILE